MDIALKKEQEKSPVIGVVAEYDPFHNGHALHLAKAASALDAETPAPVVVVLSSSFTQRGLPAFAGKIARAKMALANGANLVLELPFVHACNSAQEFARGAVEILAASRLVTHIAFGVEDETIFGTVKNNAAKSTCAAAPLLENLLSILSQEPLSFKLNLRENLASGASYPKALAVALEREVPGAGKIVSSPNNVLAVSYLLQIKKMGRGIVPIPVRREGRPHNDDAPGKLASASAIRKELKELSSAGQAWDGWTREALPASVMSILKEERAGGKLFLSDGKLWDLLRGLLVRAESGRGVLRGYAGMEEGLENLFLKHYAAAGSYDDFIGRCVCARYTRTRLQRQTIRCLAGLDRWTEKTLTRPGPPYIRVLGYDELGRELLRERKKFLEKKFLKNGETGGAFVPMITKLSSASGALARRLAAAEFQASRLRELLLPSPDLTSEEKIIPFAMP